MTIDKQCLAARFSGASGTYKQHAILQRTVMERLLTRLDWIDMQPRTVIDAGSGIGAAAEQLSKRYPRANIIHLDISFAMLAKAKIQAPRFFSRQQFICADLEQLPLAPATADIVFSSLVLQWCNDLDQTLQQIRSTLNKQGLFLFATLGPSTLNELRQSWAAVDDQPHVNTFIDIHDIGNALLRNGLVEPVLDIENITYHYPDCESLMHDLKRVGATNVNSGRAKGLSGKDKMRKMYLAYEQFRDHDRLPATYEVIYGHAWLADQYLQSGNEHYIPLTAIKRNK